MAMFSYQCFLKRLYSSQTQTEQFGLFSVNHDLYFSLHTSAKYPRTLYSARRGKWRKEPRRSQNQFIHQVTDGKMSASGHVMMLREPSWSLWRLACACRAYPPSQSHTLTHSYTQINSYTLPIPHCSTLVTYSALRNPLSNLGSSHPSSLAPPKPPAPLGCPLTC